LKTLDRAGQVIYAGTFSKALFPGLRVGYLVAPRALSTRFMLLRYAMDVHTPTLVQATLAELLASGAFERHVRRVRAVYAERRDALCAALSHALPEGVRFAPPAGGNTLWIELPAEADVALVHSGCAQRGIALHSGSPFAFEGSEAAAACDRHLVVSFANLDVSQAETCAARLADAVRRALPARRRRSA
jgi:DNA-binding transcriptional MocR family regulator